MKYFKIFIVVAGVMLFSQLQAQHYTRKEYISNYSDLAVKEMKRVGIPASITLAQGMLESGNGNSTLARKSNNHFGIKCHSDWNGKRVYHDDDKKGECFRKYKTVYESYIDHSDFLYGKQRYASLFKLKITDYKGWAYGLKKAGYATDPKYSRRLITIIEENNLQQFDSDDFKVSKDKSISSSKGETDVDHFTVDAFATHQVKLNNGVKYVTVEDGDSFESICDEFGLKKWEIYSYNDLEVDADIHEYKHLYVQPKRNKAHRKHTVYMIKEGQTLSYVSQKFGVKMSRLYRYNDMKKGDKVQKGQIIQLRRKSKD